MDITDLEKLIKSRRSVRAWQDKDVPENLLLKAIELGTWAPNGGNRQNWHFYVIKNRNVIKAIANAVQSDADKIASWPETKKVENATGQRAAGFFRTAPAAIVVAASQYQSPVDVVLAAREKVDPEARRMREWRNAANSKIQSVASATAYLLLALHQMGLGAVWMTGPIQAKGAIEKILKMPKELNAVIFIPVGYPAETPLMRERRPVSEVCEVIK